MPWLSSIHQSSDADSCGLPVHAAATPGRPVDRDQCRCRRAAVVEAWIRKEKSHGAQASLFRSAAREKILRGTTMLCDAVRVTLGPKSKSVLIQKTWGSPIVCNDGVTIAKEIDLKDPEENLGAQMLRQAADKTGEAVGDGTSTSTILAQTIFADGVRNVAAGASAIDLKRGLDRGRQSCDRGTAHDVARRQNAQGKSSGRDDFGAQ